MDKKLLADIAKEKIEFHKKELARWEKFVFDLETTGMIVLDDGALITGPDTNSSVAQPINKPTVATIIDTKLRWAEAIRKYFTEVKKNDKKKFFMARSVAKWVLTELNIPKKEYNTMKPKIYSQLATFDKQKKLESKKIDSTVYYKWIEKPVED